MGQRCRRKWNDAQIRTLRRCWINGESMRQISRRLHRSRNSVAGQLRRQKLLCTARVAPDMTAYHGAGLNLDRHPHRAAGERPCLVCTELFWSRPSQYICDKCKETEIWQSGSDFELYR
ncbi:MAG: hypothetical protein OXE84_04860 [Rhodobacteraceae bacterium]|nr:hypothetical protein [Paracoccaceae bacterium]MCY4196579.1 hypothetical protein [Paracoccaceae bacterium]